MDISSTKAVILCGGQGTRIRDLTDSPKPLVPIGDMPILWHIMKGYYTYHVKNFVLCLGYKGDMIKDFFTRYTEYSCDIAIDLRSRETTKLDGEIEDWNVILANTGEDSQTGKRIGRVRKYLEKDPYFFLTYGDGVSDVNLKKLLEFHLESEKLATITVINPRSRYGQVRLDPHGAVRAFQEKPMLKDLVNGGFMVFQNEVLRHPLFDQNVPLEIILADLTQKRQLAAYSHSGSWYSMDTRRDYEELNTMWRTGEAAWKVW